LIVSDYTSAGNKEVPEVDDKEIVKMRIQHNIMSLNAYRYYNGNNKALSTNLEKLSSGYKINRAADDAAGLAISEKMRAEITGLKTAENNAQSGVNLVQTAEGALTEVHDMLNRMVELADQSANGTYDSSTDRVNLDKEFQELKDEIDRISKASNYNSIQLLDGSLDASAKVTFYPESGVGANVKTTLDYTNTPINRMLMSTLKIGDKTYEFVKTGETSASGNVAIELSGSETPAEVAALVEAKLNGTTPSNSITTNYTVAVAGNTVTLTDTTGSANAKAATAEQNGGGLVLQIGGTADSCNQIAVAARDMRTEALGIDAVDVKDQTNAANAVDKIKQAINTVSETRGMLGAAQNRLEHTINNLTVMVENTQDAESSIRDVDVAEEMMHYTKNNILVQSAQSMLAQANQAPQGVLQLLQ